jgi:hypothetical protein
MSTNDPRPNLAARAERWSAAHWKTAVFGCLAFAVIAVMLGGSAGTKELADSETASGETARVREILDERNSESPAAEQVLVQSPRRRSPIRRSGRRSTTSSTASGLCPR